METLILGDKMTTIDLKEEARRARTQTIIDRFKGLSDEFSMLKGVLCAYHGFIYTDGLKYQDLIDTIMIAARIDEIQKEALAR